MRLPLPQVEPDATLPDSVTIYEVVNDGNWYDFGFVLGLALFSGPAMAGGRARRGA